MTLPELPFSRLAIEIALNGMAFGMLLPPAIYAITRPRASIFSLVVMLLWAASFGLLFSNLALWITRYMHQ